MDKKEMQQKSKCILKVKIEAKFQQNNVDVHDKIK